MSETEPSKFITPITNKILSFLLRRIATIPLAILRLDCPPSGGGATLNLEILLLKCLRCPAGLMEPSWDIGLEGSNKFVDLIPRLVGPYFGEHVDSLFEIADFFQVTAMRKPF